MAGWIHLVRRLQPRCFLWHAGSAEPLRWIDYGYLYCYVFMRSDPYLRFYVHCNECTGCCVQLPGTVHGWFLLDTGSDRCGLRIMADRLHFIRRLRPRCILWHAGSTEPLRRIHDSYLYRNVNL